MAALAAPKQASGAMPVLIVGCGAAARCHVDAMRATGRFECVALADTEPTAAAALSAILVSRGGKPPKVFETLEEALDADPENLLFSAVWVLTPNTKKLHTELAAMALDAGRHVLLEKPIARNLSEGRDLANKVNAIEQPNPSPSPNPNPDPNPNPNPNPDPNPRSCTTTTSGACSAGPSGGSVT